LAPGPTYAKEVSRILQDNCQVCHHAGTAAPFSLTTYEDAVKQADNIKDAVSDKRMPPWFADPHYGKFANDRRLKPADAAALLKWIAAGTPRGDMRELPPPKTWKNGWIIGEPDLVVEMPEKQEVPASGTVDYKWFHAPAPWKDDVFVTAAEIVPGNRGVVHHAEVYDGASRMIATFAPGSQPLILPPETACRFPAGRILTWLMHYTPNGKPAVDRSKVGFRFWKGDKPPKYLREILGVQQTKIDIPPGSPDALIENSQVIQRDQELISIRPHMHLRGKNFRFDVSYPDGRQECLLSVPQYDFNWQVTYEFADPPRFPKGTKLHFTSHYDNSAANPNNPDPGRRVTWGPQTSDEMQTVVLDYRQDYDTLMPKPPAAQTVGPADRPAEGPTRWSGAPVLGASALLAIALGLIGWRATIWLRRRRLPQASPCGDPS
jgi:hypothetical protein